MAAEKHAVAPQLSEIQRVHKAEIATLTARHVTEIAELQARLEAVTAERDAWTDRMGLACAEVATNPDPAHQRRMARMDEGIAMVRREIRDMEEMEAQLDLLEAKMNAQTSAPAPSRQAIPDRQSQRAEIREVLARGEAVRQEVAATRLARAQRREAINQTWLRPREPRQVLSEVATSAAKVCCTIVELISSCNFYFYRHSSLPGRFGEPLWTWS
jgi:chromosome segregation ATPase